MVEVYRIDITDPHTMVNANRVPIETMSASISISISKANPQLQNPVTKVEFNGVLNLRIHYMKSE